MSTFQTYLPTLFLLLLVYFLNALGRMIFAPLAPLLCQDMGLSHSDAGSIFLTLSTGFAISMLLSQFLSCRTSHKNMVVLSSLLMGITLVLTANCSHFFLFKLSLFSVGLGSGLFLPSAVSIIVSVMEKSDLGKSLGVFAMGQSAAGIIAPLVLEVAPPSFKMNYLLAILGIVLFVTGILIHFFLKEGSFKGEKTSYAFAKNLVHMPAFWVGVFFLCLVNGLNIGIYNMAPHYFTHENAVSESRIHAFIVFARTIGVFVAFMGGVLSDKFGLRKAIPMGFFFCGFMTLFLGALPLSSALMIFCVQAPLALCLTPMVHHFIACLVPAEQNAAVVSIVAPLGFLFGAGIVPQILGYFGDFQLYAYGFILLGIFTMGAAFLFGFSKKAFPSETNEEVEL